MARAIEAMITEAAEACGWDDATLVSVLAEFIDEYSDPDDLEAFLSRKRQEEGTSEDTEAEDAEAEHSPWS